MKFFSQGMFESVYSPRGIFAVTYSMEASLPYLGQRFRAPFEAPV